MVSLAQIPVVAAGVWIALSLQQQWSLPFPILLVPHRAAHGLRGHVHRLPALRLRGLYLALITLMGAGAITILGVSTSSPMVAVASGVSTRTPPRARPSWSARRSPKATRPTTGIAWWSSAILFLIVTWHVRGEPGRAWAAIRQSEVTAVAAGSQHDEVQAVVLLPLGSRQRRRRRRCWRRHRAVSPSPSSRCRDRSSCSPWC